jgi:phosphatidylglycerol:prolipoprotein diacylglycerol transferase
MGQLLTLPMILGGLALIAWSRRQPINKTEAATAR